MVYTLRVYTPRNRAGRQAGRPPSPPSQPVTQTFPPPTPTQPSPPPPLQTHQIFSRYSCHGQAQGMQDRVVHVRGIQQIQQLVAKVNPLDQRVDVRVHVDKAGQQ